MQLQWVERAMKFGESGERREKVVQKYPVWRERKW